MSNFSGSDCSRPFVTDSQPRRIWMSAMTSVQAEANTISNTSRVSGIRWLGLSARSVAGDRVGLGPEGWAARGGRGGTRGHDRPEGRAAL